MAVAFDAVGPSSAGASSLASTSLTWSHTCTGSNLVLLVGVAMGKGTDTGISTTATYNGVAMTSLGVVHTGGGAAGYVQLFGLANPATGANSVVVTAAGGTPGTLGGGSVSLTAADQVTPFGTPVTVASPGVATSISASVTGTTSGNYIVSVTADGSGGEVATTGLKRWSVFVDSNSAAGSAAMSTIAAPGGTQAMSWTINSDWLGEIAVEVRAAGAATDPGPAPFVLHPPGRIAPNGAWTPQRPGDANAVAATPTAAEQGAAVAGAVATGTAVKVAKVVGVATVGASSTGTARKVAAEQGSATVGTSGNGAARKLVAQLGASILGASTSGTARKVVAQLGTALGGVIGTGVDRKVAKSLGTGTAGAVGTGTARKVAPQLGATALGAVGTGIDRKVAPESGTGALGAIGTGLARKVAPQAGVATAGFVATRSSTLTRAVSGIATVGVAAYGTARKVAAQLGTATAGATSSATERKVAREGGTATAGFVATRSSILTRAVSGVATVGAAAYGTARKVAVQLGAGTAGATATSTDRKVAREGGASAVGASGSASAIAKRALQRGLVAVGVVGTRSGTDIVPAIVLRPLRGGPAADLARRWRGSSPTDLARRLRGTAADLARRFR